MKGFRKTAALLLVGVIALAASSCAGGGDNAEKDDDANVVPATLITADYAAAIDPPLVKKAAMYNAGVIDPLTNYARDLDLIEPLNAESLRIDLALGRSDGTAGRYLVYGDRTDYHYDFEQLDGVVDQINAQNVLPYMSWSYIPEPLQENGEWNNLDTSIPNWQKIWQDIHYHYAKYYKDRGTPIGYHEIYNEPDLEYLKEWGVFPPSFNGFLKLDDFKNAYLDMYEYGAKGILAADPDASIGGPAYALGEILGWTGIVNRVISKKLPMDFFSFHSYLDGNTWPNEINVVSRELSSNKHFITTAVHINEYTAQNGETGANAGLLSPYNTSEGAVKSLTGLMKAVERTDVQYVHWAQFMESTAGFDPYGIIDKAGNVKAPYNALKIYADMPVWRYKTTDSARTGLSSLASATDDKISLLVWNETGKDTSFEYDVRNAPFSDGTMRVYRIDTENASYFDDTDDRHLKAVKTVRGQKSDGRIWKGHMPNNGVVYITVNKNAAGQDFVRDWTGFAKDIKTQYYFEDRFKGIDGSYSHFQRNDWTAYLGMGDNAKAHAGTAVICTDLPDVFNIKFKSEGELSDRDNNAALGFRIDFHTGAGYTKSVYFHNGIYKTNRTAELPPWGTKLAPDTVIAFDGNVRQITLSEYAPAGFDGKAQISFQMQNTGKNTRAEIKLSV
jgi:hypothetical protein